MRVMSTGTVFKPDLHFASICCFLLPGEKAMVFRTGRRMCTIASFGSLMIAKETLVGTGRARGLELGIGVGVSEQTLEEVERGFQLHVQSLLQVKELLKSEAWDEAERELRKSSSNLKLDMYSIIQNKPVGDRSTLRKLYSQLFNSVTRLEYATRDRNLDLVQQLCRSITDAVEEILSKI